MIELSLTLGERFVNKHPFLGKLVSRRVEEVDIPNDAVITGREVRSHILWGEKRVVPGTAGKLRDLPKK